MTGRPKGLRNKKKPLDEVIDEALGGEQVIPELQKARKQVKQMIKKLLWKSEDEDNQGQK